MKTITKILGVALLAGSAYSGLTHAANILDSGVPDNSGMPLSLDGNDYYAAKFFLGAGQTITGIQGYITGGDYSAVGDTYTIALYDADGSHGLPHRQEFSAQATYQADGWNGLGNLSWSGLAAGNYWVAFEVGAYDNTAGLQLPIVATIGSVPALSYAFNTGGGYQTMSGENIGVQIAAVPEPEIPALLLSGLLVIGAVARSKLHKDA